VWRDRPTPEPTEAPPAARCPTPGLFLSPRGGGSDWDPPKGVRGAPPPGVGGGTWEPKNRGPKKVYAILGKIRLSIRPKGAEGPGKQWVHGGGGPDMGDGTPGRIRGDGRREPYRPGRKGVVDGRRGHEADGGPRNPMAGAEWCEFWGVNKKR